MGNTLLREDHERLIMFTKLSVNFRKNSKRWIVKFIFYIQHKFSKILLIHPEHVPNILNQAMNSVITGQTVCTKNINPLVFCIGAPAVGLYVRTSGFKFSQIESPVSY